MPDFVRFLLGTGCRLGEAVGVRREDLDLDRHLVRVRRTIIRVKGRGLVAKAPKTQRHNSANPRKPFPGRARPSERP